MIGIQLQGDSEFLDTTPDTSIDLMLENPIVGEDDKLSPGSYSFPFSLPIGSASPKNSAKLQHPTVIENNAAYQIQKARLFFNGVPFNPGKLKTKASSKNKASAYFTFGLSTIDESIKTASLRDVVNLNVSISSTSRTKKLYVKKLVDPDDDWNITVNGTNYTGTKTEVLGDINNNGELTVDTGKHVPFAVPDPGFNSPKGFLSPDYIIISLVTYVTSFDPITQTWIPFPVDSGDPLQPLSVSVEEPEKYLIEPWDFDDYYNDFDNFVNSFPVSTLVFPVLFNAKPYSDNTIKRGELVNGANASGLIRNYEGGLNTHVINRNSLQPFIKLKYVLDRIADRFNFEWEGDFYEHPEMEGFLIDNTAGLDVPQEWIQGEIFVFWRRSFNLSDLVPDIKVVEFLSALKSRYNLAIYFNESTGKVRMCFREAIVKKNEYTDITRHSSPIEHIEDQRVTGFSLTVPKEDSDDLSVTERIEIGEPEIDLEVKCGRIHQSGSAVVSGGLITGIRVASEFGEKFGLRLFHYNGPVNNGSYSYRSCSISSDSFFEPLSSSGSDLGIYEVFWKYWLAYRKNRRSVKLKVAFPFRLVRMIDWELKRRFDRNNYLIKSISVRLTNQRVNVADVELYTMK